jgi:hypothetical protein
LEDRNGHSRFKNPRTVPHPPSPGHKAGTGPNNDKDKVENRLYTAVCNGKITVAQAQSAIATDWTTARTSVGLG